MSEYTAMALGSIAGMMEAEQSRRAGGEMIALLEARKNRPPQVDVNSFYKLINDHNQLVAQYNDLRLQVLRRDTIIAERELELANLTGKFHQLEFQLQAQKREGAASVQTIGQFLKAYQHYRDLLGIETGDPYDVPGYW